MTQKRAAPRRVDRRKYQRLLQSTPPPRVFDLPNNATLGVYRKRITLPKVSIIDDQS